MSIAAMLLHLPSASTYSGDVDGLVLWVTLLTGFWFLAARALFQRVEMLRGTDDDGAGHGHKRIDASV